MEKLSDKKPVKPMSKAEKASFILRSFPNLGKSSKGRSLENSLKKIVKSQKDEIADFKISDNKSEIDALLSSFYQENLVYPASHQTKNKTRKTNLKPKNDTSFERFSNEHPIIILKEIEKYDEAEKKDALKRLPGSLARQISFLMSNHAR